MCVCICVRVYVLTMATSAAYYRLKAYYYALSDSTKRERAHRPFIYGEGVGWGGFTEGQHCNTLEESRARQRSKAVAMLCCKLLIDVVVVATIVFVIASSWWFSYRFLLLLCLLLQPLCCWPYTLCHSNGCKLLALNRGNHVAEHRRDVWHVAVVVWLRTGADSGSRYNEFGWPKVSALLPARMFLVWIRIMK